MNADCKYTCHYRKWFRIGDTTISKKGPGIKRGGECVNSPNIVLFEMDRGECAWGSHEMLH